MGVIEALIRMTLEFPSMMVPWLLVGAVTALLWGVGQWLVVLRSRWACRAAILPVAAVVIWYGGFIASGLMGNLGALVLFGPPMVLWPLGLGIGGWLGGKMRKGRS